MKENFKQGMLENSDTRLYEMSVADLGSFRQKNDRVKSDKGRTSPGKRIPSTTKFEITLNEMNIVLAQIGISRRLTNEMDFGDKPHGNKPMNHYMSGQVSRLYECLDLGNTEEFFNRCTYLMRNSVAFRTSALNKCFPRGYKTMPFSFMININNKVTKIFDTKSTDLEFKRVYIPKTPADEEIGKKTGNHKEFIAKGGRGRPLGVPQHAGRVVLHMGTNFLVMFIEGYIGKRQHGFIPGRGTLTAGRAIVSNMHKYKYIMEIDLANCFGEVQANAASEILERLGMPTDIVEYIEKINLCSPKFADADLVDESAYRSKKKVNEIGNSETNADTPIQAGNTWATRATNALNSEREMLLGNVAEISALYEKARQDGTLASNIRLKVRMSVAQHAMRHSKLTEKPLELIKQLGDLLREEEANFSTPNEAAAFIRTRLPLRQADGGQATGVNASAETHKGLPQGANGSPILTAMVLKDFTSQCEDSVFYADDGLFFSNSPITLKDDSHKGIYINYKKRSGYVKFDGKFTKDFVFLGLEYKHKTDMIAGHTHKGSRLEFDSREEDIFKTLELLKPDKHYNRKKWELLFHSSIGGTIMSSLYNASGEQLEYLIHGNPEGNNGSGLKLKGLMDNFRTTSSDACFALSRVIGDRKEPIHSNKKGAEKVNVLQTGASEADDAQTVKIILDNAKGKGDHKKSYRAMFVNGRGIRKKVVETLKLSEYDDSFFKIWQSITNSLAYGLTLKGEFNSIIIEGAVDLKKQYKDSAVARFDRSKEFEELDFIDEG